MINVYTNRENYQYDLHALVKSFYPEHDVRVCAEQLLPRQTDKTVNKNIQEQDSTKQVIVHLADDSMKVVFDIDGRKEYSHTYENCTDVIKKECKLSLYHDLCDYTGKTLPWGNLTGIRPTKLAMGMVAEGKCDAEIVAWLKETHAVSDEKAYLSIDIARREKTILDRIHYEDGYSIYIGIPFCPTTCLYCSFTSYPIAAWRGRTGEYLQALFREIDFVAQAYKDKILDTIYIGGGTQQRLRQKNWTSYCNTFMTVLIMGM